MESRTGESTMNGGVHNYIDKIIDVQKHVLFRYAFESNKLHMYLQEQVRVSK